jgi:aclacinomycin oxidase
MLQNHGNWSERNSDPDSPNRSLWTLLIVHRQQLGKIILRGLSTEGSTADRQIDDYMTTISEGIPAPLNRQVESMSWLDFALNPFPDLFAMPPGGVSTKVKDAMLKKRLTDRQIAIAYDFMTRTDYDVPGGVIGFATYGGRVNALAPDATASAQRESIFDMACNAGWMVPQDADKNLKWVRAFYRDLFAETGGVPVPGSVYDGAFINHPDTDLADAALNTSGVPWQTLYYKTNYGRLQQIKTRWDPRNVFSHALAVRAE